MAKVPPITQRYYFSVPPKRVFAALTDPKQLSRWFVEKATISPQKGKSFEFTWRGGYTLKGKVTEVGAQRRLGLDWNDRFDGGKTFETHVRFVLRKNGRGTVLTLTHRGFKSGKKWVVLYGAIQSGWAFYMANLRSVLEHGTDLRSKLDLI
jgi:uncharacterized protein YndB with AHSA1/START domain